MVDSSQGEKERGKAQIVDSENFFRFLDREVSRCRRYQHFFCLLLFRIEKNGSNGSGAPQIFIYRKLLNLLADEMRESDIIASPDDRCVTVILPYGDPLGGEKTRKRIQDNLRYYEFGMDGYEVRSELICFPAGGSTTGELMEKIKGR